MLNKDTLPFLKELEKNNNKEWFDANRKRYEGIRADFMILVNAVITELGKFDKDIAKLEAKNCVFRINRDIRFSKNKAPYKNNMGGYFSKGGKKTDLAGFYFHLQPGQCFIAAGCWQPEAPNLKKIRQEIDYNGADFETILKDKAFKKTFGSIQQEDKLNSVPKGYDKENEYAEYLKLKSFIVSCVLSEKVLYSQTAVKDIVAYFKVAVPFVNFLNNALE